MLKIRDDVKLQKDCINITEVNILNIEIKYYPNKNVNLIHIK